jgi:hypothetical protein
MVEGCAPCAPRTAPRGPGPVLAPRAERWRVSGHVVGTADVPQWARTDALGRPTWTRLADGTERRERYHAGGGLAAIEVTTPDGAFTSTPIVDALTRDAHGRLAAARLGDACVVTWAYDRETGRLVAQDARRGARWYQGLRYIYDADGRMTRALDLAQDGPGAIVPSAVSARRDHRYDVHGRSLVPPARPRLELARVPHARRHHRPRGRPCRAEKYGVAIVAIRNSKPEKGGLMATERLGGEREREIDHLNAAVEDAMEKGHTLRRCLRCGGELVVELRASGCVVWCRSEGATVYTLRGL